MFIVGRDTELKCCIKIIWYGQCAVQFFFYNTIPLSTYIYEINMKIYKKLSIDK